MGSKDGIDFVLTTSHPHSCRVLRIRVTFWPVVRFPFCLPFSLDFTVIYSLDPCLDHALSYSFFLAKTSQQPRTRPSEPHESEKKRTREYCSGQSIDGLMAAGWGYYYLAENTRSLLSPSSRHAGTCDRWAPTTGSERRDRAHFHSQSTPRATHV